MGIKMRTLYAHEKVQDSRQNPGKGVYLHIFIPWFSG